MNNNFNKFKNDIKRILGNKEYITVFLYGSKAVGLSHNLSDTDVMIVSHSDSLRIEPSPELEMQVISIANIEKAAKDMLESKFFNNNSQILLANLYHGVALLNSTNFNAIKQSLQWDIIIHNMIDDRLRGYEFYKKDAYKYYNTLDCNSSRFCFQKSLESLIDAYMFSKNRLIVKEKWRIKWLQQNNSQLYDELISLYCTIWSNEALSSVISRLESYCTKILQLIQEGDYE